MSRPLSLTALGQAAVAVLVLALLGGGAWLAGFDPGRVRLTPASTRVEASPIARRLIVYQLDKVRPTVFRFTQPLTLARIVAQPVLHSGTALPGRSWTYTIKADLLGDDGTVLAVRQITSRALLIDSTGRRIGRRQFFRGSSDEIALGDEVRIGFAQPFAAMRLTVVETDPSIKAINVRLSERRPLIASAAESAFRRLSPDDQLRLAEPNAFPPALLTPAESTAIAINQWRPVGPLGIEGRDHVMAVLYEEEAPADTAWEVETEEATGE